MKWWLFSIFPKNQFSDCKSQQSAHSVQMCVKYEIVPAANTYLTIPALHRPKYFILMLFSIKSRIFTINNQQRGTNLIEIFTINEVLI